MTTQRSRQLVRAVPAVLLLAALSLSIAAPAEARGGVWQRNYERNYFSSLTTCENYGYAKVTPGHAGYIPGVVNYYCHKNSGEPKWSIDLYWLT